MTEEEKRILAAKQSFEQSFAESAFYNRQTQDAAHLAQILSFLPLKDGVRILDFGTGSGYLAFEIAQKLPSANVTGLDILEKTLDTNRLRAAQNGISNLRFISYDGSRFPFADGSFDLVVSRYVLHHVPDIRRCITEISRVLRPGGCFFLSDPAPNAVDSERFVDRYMQLKPDGHIRFYTKEEWKQTAAVCELQFSDSFDSTIRFPRRYTPEYTALLEQTAPDVLRSYDISHSGDEIFITEQVNNMLFTK